MLILVIQSGTYMSSTDIDINPNILNRHVARPNIHNRHRPQANNYFLLMQLYVSSAPVPQLSPTDAGPLQLTLGILNLHQGSSEFFNRLQLFPKFSNRRRGCPNNLQPTPQIPEILSTDARAFEMALRLLWGRPEYWLPAFPNTLVGSNGHLTALEDWLHVL